MPSPTKETWKNIANDFEQFWQFPHCVGTIDGKHVAIQAPPNRGSLFFNYRKRHSIVLLAVVVDVGAYGRQSDGVLSHSTFGHLLKNDALSLPESQPICGTGAASIPYVFVGDEAFPLRHNLMHPYPGRNLPLDKRICN